MILMILEVELEESYHLNKNINYETYDKVCPSIKDYLYQKPPQFSVCTLGQMHHIQEKGWSGWYSDYFTSLK